MHALIVDDNPHVVSITERWLSDAGYSVATAYDFEDAARQLINEMPDIVLVDVRLGTFNGLQLAIKAREQFPGARIVVMSAWDDPVLKHEAEQCGACYIVKPFTGAQLLEAIGRRN
jgi:DNA-binding response OmpR family regulator